MDECKPLLSGAPPASPAATLPSARRLSTVVADSPIPAAAAAVARAAAANAALAAAAAAAADDPNSGSEGYGEMTEGSIERLLLFLGRVLTPHPHSWPDTASSDCLLTSACTCSEPDCQLLTDSREVV